MNKPGQPAISVCIANYNGERMLVDCIDSVLAQQCDATVEVIVHDDASTDGSVALVQQRYPQVRLIVSESNVGFCISNNRMVDVAHGTFVLLLNNDAALLPGALESLLAGAAEQDPHGILTLPQYDWQSGALVDRGCLLDFSYNPVPNDDPLIIDVAYVIGACLWISKELWVELGGFPEWMGSIGEDLYLCCRARIRGSNVQSLPGSGYRHRQGASFGGNRASKEGLKTTYRRRRMSERNKTATMIVCTPTAIVWPLLALHLLAFVIEGIAFSAMNATLRPWREIYRPTLASMVAMRTELRAHRQRVQAQRSTTLRQYLRPFTPFPHKLRLLLRHGIPHVE